MSADPVLEQPNGQEPGFYEVQDELRLIRAENEKRDRELALMRAELVVFRSQLDVSRTHLETIVSVLGTHTMIFSDRNCNYPQPKYANWFLSQYRRWGMVEGPPDYEGIAKR
ncbi:MAG: hypothetical protein LC776_19090 [Acidobacteria bacterium]|nr:hypothetical protein [Acidobacteriota bacterium]